MVWRKSWWMPVISDKAKKLDGMIRRKNQALGNWIKARSLLCSDHYPLRCRVVTEACVRMCLCFNNYRGVNTAMFANLLDQLFAVECQCSISLSLRDFLKLGGRKKKRETFALWGWTLVANSPSRWEFARALLAQPNLHLSLCVPKRWFFRVLGASWTYPDDAISHH